MGRVSMLLAVVLMVSAFSLVTARFQSRQLFVQLESLQTKAKDLDTEWRRLQLERAEFARNARIDDIARTELGMVSPGIDRTIYLTTPATTTELSGGRGR